MTLTKLASFCLVFAFTLALLPSLTHAAVHTDTLPPTKPATLAVSHITQTIPVCGITNHWVGNSSRWANDELNWSESIIPTEFHNVLIDNGAIVTAANDVPPNIDFIREYLVSTFEVGIGSGFSVDPGAEFHAIPSQAGPYTISGSYFDQNPDCDDPLFCTCCRGLSIIDHVNCYYEQSDYGIQATYSITGKIITVIIEAQSGPNYETFYRIIDNNNIVELGTADVLSKN